MDWFARRKLILEQLDYLKAPIHVLSGVSGEVQKRTRACIDFSRIFLDKPSRKAVKSCWDAAEAVRNGGAVSKQAQSGLEQALHKLDAVPPEWPLSQDLRKLCEDLLRKVLLLNAEPHEVAPDLHDTCDRICTMSRALLDRRAKEIVDEYLGVLESPERCTAGSDEWELHLERAGARLIPPDYDGMASGGEHVQDMPFRHLRGLHHGLMNMVTLPADPGRARDICRRIRAEIEAQADRWLPEHDRLVELLKSIEATGNGTSDTNPWLPLATYLEVHAAALQKHLEDANRAWQYAGRRLPRQIRKGKTPPFLIVEDEKSWQTTLKALISRVAGSDAEIHVTDNCVKARELMEDMGKRQPVAICDIGLPEDAGDATAKRWSEENGRRLIRELAGKASVIALTTWDRFDRDFVELGCLAEDFIPKTTRDIEGEVLARLQRLLVPSAARDLVCVVPSFDAQRVWIAGVWAELPPLAFAVVDALANGIDSDALFSQPDFGQEVALRRQPPRLPRPLSLEELKHVMCLREVTDLPFNFMEAFDDRAAREHFHAAHRALRKAVNGAGIHSEDLMTIDKSSEGAEPRYSLRCRALPCDTPHEFRMQFDAGSRPFRILVVEDEEEWRHLICGELKRLQGAEIRTAACFEDAYREFIRFSPDLVCLDLNIPRDGVAGPQNGVVLKTVLSMLEETSHSRYLVFTSYDDASLRKSLLRTGRTGESSDPGSCLQPRDILLKRNRDESLQRLRLHAWRIRQEMQQGGRVTATPATLRDVVVNSNATGGWLLKVDGKSVPSPARRGNTPAEHAIVLTLAEYANVSLRRISLLQILAARDVLPKVKNLGDWLNHRVLRLREAIAAHAQVPGEDILHGAADGYSLRGNVTVF